MPAGYFTSLLINPSYKSCITNSFSFTVTSLLVYQFLDLFIHALVHVHVGNSANTLFFTFIESLLQVACITHFSTTSLFIYLFIYSSYLLIRMFTSSYLLIELYIRLSYLLIPLFLCLPVHIYSYLFIYLTCLFVCLPVHIYVCNFAMASFEKPAPPLFKFVFNTVKECRRMNPINMQKRSADKSTLIVCLHLWTYLFFIN